MQICSLFRCKTYVSGVLAICHLTQHLISAFFARNLPLACKIVHERDFLNYKCSQFFIVKKFFFVNAEFVFVIIVNLVSPSMSRFPLQFLLSKRERHRGLLNGSLTRFFDNQHSFMQLQHFSCNGSDFRDKDVILLNCECSQLT